MPSVTETVKVLSAECDESEVYVSQAARFLVNSGTLPKSSGRRVAQVTEKDVCMLLLAVLTATPTSTFVDAPARAVRYAQLKRNGEEGAQTLISFLAKVMEDIHTRRRRGPLVTFAEKVSVPYNELRIEIITSYPAVTVSTVPSSLRHPYPFSATFAETPDTAKFWPSNKPQRSVTIPGEALFAIVSGLFGEPVLQKQDESE